jgi:hypothetical protein
MLDFSTIKDQGLMESEGKIRDLSKILVILYSTLYGTQYFRLKVDTIALMSLMKIEQRN